MENRDNYVRYRVRHNGEFAHVHAGPDPEEDKVRISKFDIVCTEREFRGNWAVVSELKTKKGWDDWYNGMLIETKFLQLAQVPNKVYGSVSNQRAQ